MKEHDDVILFYFYRANSESGILPCGHASCHRVSLAVNRMYFCLYFYETLCVWHGSMLCYCRSSRDLTSNFFFQLSLLLRIVVVMNQKECQVDFIFKYRYRHSALESGFKMS